MVGSWKRLAGVLLRGEGANKRVCHTVVHGMWERNVLVHPLHWDLRVWLGGGTTLLGGWVHRLSPLNATLAREHVCDTCHVNKSQHEPRRGPMTNGTFSRGILKKCEISLDNFGAHSAFGS
jgi:hypothetical protein